MAKLDFKYLISGCDLRALIFMAYHYGNSGEDQLHVEDRLERYLSSLCEGKYAKFQVNEREE